MKNYQLGDIVYVNLNPTRGVETSDKKPCVIVSNNQYNRYLNTVIIAPISNSSKYIEEPKYYESPLFITIPTGHEITGTILLQHLRSIDPKVRISDYVVDRLPTEITKQVQDVIQSFFK